MMQDLLTKGIGHTKFKDSPIGKIPSEWTVVELEKVSKIVDCKHRTAEYFEVGYPVVRPRDIKEGMLDLSNCILTNAEELDDLNEKHTPTRGDIVYSRNGTYGVASYVNDDQKFAIGQDVCLILAEKVLSKFVYYQLNSFIVKNQVNAVAAGSTFMRINLNTIKKFNVAVPGSSAEEEKITEILSSIDSNLEGKLKKLEKMEKVKKGLMQDLLTGKVRVKV
jgi:type I restriction enzyme S subunit